MANPVLDYEVELPTVRYLQTPSKNWVWTGADRPPSHTQVNSDNQ